MAGNGMTCVALVDVESDRGRTVEALTYLTAEPRTRRRWRARRRRRKPVAPKLKKAA